MLKRSPSLTEQTKSYIKQRIINDEFEEGRIPSETALAEELGVSRTTIRDALSRLELEGTIYRKQGAGTFVNEASLRIRTRLEEIWTYEAMLEAHGYTPSTEIISVETQTAPPKLASELNLPSRAEVLRVKKRFFADDQPVIFVENYIPVHILQHTYTAETFHTPMYQVLADVGQQHLAYYVSEIVPLVPAKWLRDLLALKPNSAILSFDEVGYNQDNQPIVKSYSYFKDSLLRLRLLRREAI